MTTDFMATSIICESDYRTRCSIMLALFYRAGIASPACDVVRGASTRRQRVKRHQECELDFDP
ncbi:hypothetical protein LQG66_33415 [Bradyrhizobium ontarionense]|uniref:Uncharacterized protein n=1 Tax=Bradyrhizobium ontarionense TaxID=2898149 RepID=A0ABY3RB87_9BRAD|nr:hypothetical protein [Bradyrhizobium sp. A19]UFZ04038.1 hypothetical protein LQG66_33415 [Bradyrhizobium sp. A19]